MTQNRNKIAVIGGDARQLIAASKLVMAGYEVALWGFGFEKQAAASPIVDSLCCSDSTITAHELLENLADMSVCDCGVICPTPTKAIENAFAVVLPLPTSADSNKISMPLCDGTLTLSELSGIMASSGTEIVCGGKLPRGFSELCDARGVEVFDYYEREEFAVANAIPSAEGAIEIAMRELPITLHGSRALVIGYGRIGKVLSRLLKALGVHVSASARKPSDLAWIRADGISAAHTSELSTLFEKIDFDMIFNTVPHRVLGKAELENIRVGTLIVDLASKPGGVDTEAADSLSHSVIWALSLPGKVAPVTSGHIIADTVLAHLEKYKRGE